MPSARRIANIAVNDAMILPYDANRGRMEFSERTTLARRAAPLSPRTARCSIGMCFSDARVTPMVPSLAPLFAPFRRLRGATILLALMVAGASDASALAETSYDNPATAEGWAWAKIKQGNAADFNERCKTTPALDARKDDDASWKSDCRQLDATFLVDILTQPAWGEKVPMAGVHIVGAKIVGDIALTNARVNRELWIEKSRIESKIVLDGARTNSPISFNSSHVSGTLSASQFHDERSLSLLNTKFEQDVLLDFAKIDGFATLDDTIFESELNLESAQIGAALFMRRAAAHKTVNLKYAKVAGAVELNGSKFDAELIANSLQVGAELSMSDRTSIQNLNLYAAQIGGDVLMAGAEISGVLKVLAMQIGGNLYMGTDANTGTNARYQTVYLSASKIEGYVDLGGAIVDGDLDAMALQVNHSVNANGARFHKVVLVLASIKGEFALSRAQFVGDLTAHALNVGGNLMADGASFRKVELALAKVGGTVEFSGASFADDLDAHQARINGDLLMKKGATFQSVNINNVNVAGNVEVEGSRYDGAFDAAFLQVGGYFSMSKVVALKDVNWFQANIAKQLAVSETEFGGEFLAPGIKVGDYVGIISNTSFAKKAILASATIGRHLFIDHSQIRNTRSIASDDRNGPEAKWRGFVVSCGERPMTDLEISIFVMRISASCRNRAPHGRKPAISIWLASPSIALAKRCRTIKNATATPNSGMNGRGATGTMCHAPTSNSHRYSPPQENTGWSTKSVTSAACANMKPNSVSIGFGLRSSDGLRASGSELILFEFSFGLPPSRSQEPSTCARDRKACSRPAIVSLGAGARALRGWCPASKSTRSSLTFSTTPDAND